MADVEAMADMVILAIKSALAPVQARQAALQEQLTGFEARWADLGALRERVAVMEAKAIPVALDTSVVLAPVLERLAVAETRLVEVDKYAARIEGYTSFIQRDAVALSERVAVIETRPQLKGDPGKDGDKGDPGQDGKAGLTYQGVFQDGKSYDVGELVTFGGSTWHANEATSTKPGDGSKAWTLIVKRGRDGKDGKDGEAGRQGRDLTKEDVASWRS